MSDTMEDIAREAYLQYSFSGYHELIDDLGNCATTKEFKLKLEEINGYMAKEPYIFGKGAHFVSPAIIENVEAVRLIQRNWNQYTIEQAKDKADNRRYFWFQLVLSFLLGIGATYFYERFLAPRA